MKFLIFLIFVSFIPHIKKIKNDSLILITFLILLAAFIVVPFYGFEFAYRYHAEYAFPFIFLESLKQLNFLKKIHIKIVTLVCFY